MDDLVGIGLYDRQEAARLVGVQPGMVARWLRGYRSSAGNDVEPMWRADVQIPGELTLSFRDLMELRATTAFRRAGLSAQMIRKAIRKAEEVLGTDHPFSTARFRTDGARIMLEVEPDAGEPKLLDVFKNQYVIGRLIEQSLSDVTFDGMSPVQWRPRGAKGGILLDPERSFGQPVEECCYVPTRTLADAVASERGDVDKVARLYEVPVRSVRRALQFERDLATAA